MKHILDVDHLTVRFPNKKAKKGEPKVITAVEDISFVLYEDEMIGIVGESGCGKTTLSRGILSLIPTSEGRVVLEGEDTKILGRRAVSDRIQMIFQNPLSSFHPLYTIWDSLLEVAKVHRIPKKQAKKDLETLFSYVGLTYDLAKKYPSQLSGGQLQRFAICRALLLKPKVLIADEVVSALDVSIQRDIIQLLLYLRQKLHIAILFISHDLNLVEHICDNTAVMYLGTVVEKGPTKELFRNPKHPYTKLLFSSKTKTDPDEISKKRDVFEDIPNILEVPAGCKFQNRCPEFKKGICDQKRPTFVQVEGDHYVTCLRSA